VNLTVIPWDFFLILIVLGTLVPWRGAVRVKRLLSQQLPGGAERLSLYVSTIAYQWLIVAIVAWRAFSRGLNLIELGLTAADPWRTTWIALALTVLLCANQFASLRMMARVPDGQRGFLFRLTEKIMPRTMSESVVFTALACTAGLSEEFLYRGFVFAVFKRMFVNPTFSIPIAVILSSAWFAIAHLYQGKRGIITTFIVGILFCAVRLWSGSLLPSVAAHMGIDLVAGLYASRFLRDG
jgi:membrane protease YdiL (CAAX protease family)